jgi:8-oxo-dGTP diphosphatase
MTHWQDRFTVTPAVYVIFHDGDKLLLLKRANSGYRDGYFSFPAVHIDGGEPAVMAAVREAKEELGVDIEPKDLQLVFTQHLLAESGDHERIHLFFEARKWRGEPRNAEPQKCDEILWAPITGLPAKLVPELKEFLKATTAGDSYGHYGF